MDIICVKEDVLEKIIYGFYVVMIWVDWQELFICDCDYIVVGMISWVMQSSFEFLMVIIVVVKDLDLNEIIFKVGFFVLNILGKEDKVFVDDFVKDSVIWKDQIINGYDFLNGIVMEVFIFDCGIGYLECEFVDQVKIDGDYVFFIGKVVNSDLW